MRSASASSAPTTLSGWLTKSHRGSAAPTHRRFFSSLGYSVSYSRSETSSSSSQTGSFDLRDVELIDEVEPQIIRLQISGKKHPILIALHGAQPEAHAWRRLWASAVPPEAVGERMAAHRSAVLAAKLKERYAAQPRNAQSSSSFSLSRGGSSSLSAKTTPRQMPSTSELQTQDSTLSFVSIGDVTEQAPEAGDPRTPFAAAPAPRPHAVPPINLSQMGESACEQAPAAASSMGGFSRPVGLPPNGMQNVSKAKASPALKMPPISPMKPGTTPGKISEAQLEVARQQWLIYFIKTELFQNALELAVTEAEELAIKQAQHDAYEPRRREWQEYYIAQGDYKRAMAIAANEHERAEIATHQKQRDKSCFRCLRCVS